MGIPTETHRNPQKKPTNPLENPQKSPRKPTEPICENTHRLNRAGGTGPAGPALAGPILCHYGLFSYANLLLAGPTFAMAGPIKSCFRRACLKSFPFPSHMGICLFSHGNTHRFPFQIPNSGLGQIQLSHLRVNTMTRESSQVIDIGSDPMTRVIRVHDL